MKQINNIRTLSLRSKNLATNVVTIIIPVYNEENTIAELIRRVYNAKTPGWKKQMIVVDDSSVDKTGKILNRLRKKYGFVLLKHTQNKGKGAAIKSALARYQASLARLHLASVDTLDTLLTQDADLEYDPKDYETLLRAYHPKKSPVIYGSRNMGTTNRGYLLTHLTGRALSFIFNLIFGTKITDINTGYKLFRADILHACDLKVDGFDFCHEVTAKVLKMGYKIREVPINYYPRSWAEGKKVRPKDAWLDLWTTIKYRFVR